MRKFVKAALTKGEQNLLEFSNYESAAIEAMNSGLNFKKAHDLFRIAKNFSSGKECLNKGVKEYESGRPDNSNELPLLKHLLVTLYK